jgi:hypothetical protein
MTKCLPESVFIEPVTETPEGKAFLAKYPDPEFHVDQMCLEDRNVTCSVDIVQSQDPSVPEGARVTLVTHVNVTSFSNPDVSIGEKRLACVNWVNGQLDVWTVRGDILQKLQPETPDCWDAGPPPPPSDDELIQRARQHPVAKVYLERHPHNAISVDRIEGRMYDLTSATVTFIPSTLEPIRLVVHFVGLDYEIPFVSLGCTYKNQTWFIESDDPNFWSYLRPERGDCWDYPPPE